MEREEAEFRAANKRIVTMAEELRKAELVRDRLEGLDRLMGSYSEGHDMRTRLEPSMWIGLWKGSTKTSGF